MAGVLYSGKMIACSGQTTAGGAALFAIVLIVDVNTVVIIEPVHAKETEIDAFHAIGASTVINDRIPSASGRFHEFLGRDRGFGGLDLGRDRCRGT